MRRLDEGRRWAANAIETDDRNEAIEWWQKVFGTNQFPSTVDDDARAQAEAGYPGTAFTLGTGLIVPTRPQTGTYTPIPQTTFHGDANK